MLHRKATRRNEPLFSRNDHTQDSAPKRVASRSCARHRRRLDGNYALLLASASGPWWNMCKTLSHSLRHVGPLFGVNLRSGDRFRCVVGIVTATVTWPVFLFALETRPLDRARLGRAPVRPALTYARLFAIFAANPIAKRTLASRITLGAANVSFGPVSVATKATCIK